MSNIIYISKKCQYSKQLLIMIYKNPMLKEMFRIECVENSPIPPFIKTVPTLFNETNNSVISGTDLFNLINSYVQQTSGGGAEESQAPGGDQRNAQAGIEAPKEDEELAPWNGGEMGGSISSCYSFLDNDNPIQNSFELIGEGVTGAGTGPGGDLPKPEMSGGDVGSDKRQMFDNDYENFIKNRNAGIPQSNNRA